MSVLEIIQKSAEFLSKKGVDSPRLQIELLLAHVLKMPRMKLYLDFERELTQFLETRHSAVCADILDKKEITSETQDTLRRAIDECKSTFLSKVGAA